IHQTHNRDLRAAFEASTHSNADMGARAAEMAIERAGIGKQDIGMVIAGSSAPDTVSPAEACNVACALGLEVPAFDVHSACTSFLAVLWIPALARPASLPRLVLVARCAGVAPAVVLS